jgi:superfamily II DNA or RNA helicase
VTHTLRPRQTQAIADLQRAYSDGARAPVLVAPTGFGKTATAVDIVRMAWARGRSVWFLAHLDEILTDTANRLEEAGLPFGRIQPGFDRDYHQQIQVVSVWTAVNRLDLPPADFIIIDECHLAVAPSYMAVVERAGNPFLLGLTGTPQRRDGQPLARLFDRLVLTCSTAELVGEGLLSPVRLFRPQATNLMGSAIVGDALEHWQRRCHDRRGVLFCRSVDEARAVAKRWHQAGYRAVAVSGTSPKAERRAAVDGLRSGDLDAVACVDLWIAGVDIRQISAISWLRKTTSLVTWRQGNGRGMRIDDGKTDLIIHDHAGNRHRLGHPLDEPDWSLEGWAERRPPKAFPVRECPQCFVCLPGGTRECPECGHEFRIVSRKPRQVAGELVEDAPSEGPSFAEERSGAQGLEDLIRIGHRRGMANPRGWAMNVLKARQVKMRQRRRVAA